MESTYELEKVAEPASPEIEAAPAPALILLESAEGAEVCAVDGECA